MTKTIKVDRTKTRCDEDSIQDYIKVLNGIAYDCSAHNGYSQGWRNQVAVDMTVSSWMLGLDAHEILCWFMNAGLIDPLMDDESSGDRVSRVLNYVDSFSWDWMINPDGYMVVADEIYKSDGTIVDDDPYIVLKFELA